MEENEKFFSPDHDRLISIAVWAKYLAWVVLLVNILWAVAIYFQEQNYFLFYKSTGVSTAAQAYRDFTDLLTQVPSYGLSIFIEIIGTVLKGVVYFLVLRGISLGLDMILEIELNQREQLGELE